MGKSAWLSKTIVLNALSLIVALATLFTGVDFGLPPEVAHYAAIALAVANVVNLWLRTAIRRGWAAWDGDRWVRGLVATAALALALGQPPAQTGYAVRYAETVMERVAAARDIPPQACMVAWTAAQDHDIGRTWLRVVGPAGALKCLVVDLPHPRRAGLPVALDLRQGIVRCVYGDD